LTWAALTLLVWERVKLRISPANEFYADANASSIRPQVEKWIGRRINCPEGLGGYLEPQT
jgi:hypothetical protein